jgi:ribokinase
MSSVVVVGSYGVGLTVALDRVPAAGETVVGHAFSAGPGGKGSNQAIAAARLGASVELVSAVGSDEHGRQARELWAAESVGHEGVRILDGTTMVGVILVDATGENRIAIVPGVLDEMTPRDLGDLQRLLSEADALLVSLEIPVDVAFAALRAGRDAGVITILNPAPAPDGPLPDEMLGLVDHLTPNRTEALRLAQLPEQTDPDEVVRAECFNGIGTVVLTLGEEGVLLRTSSGLVRIPAPHVEAVDSTGAGDTFNGAYASQLAMGVSTVDAARFAVAAASLSVSRAEVVPSLPRLAEVTSLMEGSPAR